MCIRRTLAYGRLHGLVSGLGAASADAIYGILAAFGLTVITNLLLERQLNLTIIGGMFLIYLGIKTWRTLPGNEAAPVSDGRGLVYAYASTLFLTLTNPVTVLSFLAIFAGITTGAVSMLASAVIVVGVFTGSALWWTLLSGGVSLFRRHFDARAMRWINRLSGAIITLFGVGALIGVLA